MATKNDAMETKYESVIGELGQRLELAQADAEHWKRN